MTNDLRLWVVDTSSLIQVRQAGMSAARQAEVFRALKALAVNGRLIFPFQVRSELEWIEGSHPEDQALVWVRSVRDRAERTANLEVVQKILARAPQLIDAASQRDQADPYVIALALESGALGGVTILTDDRIDRFDGRGNPRKLSVATVAGSYDVPVVPLAGFILRALPFADSKRL